MKTFLFSLISLFMVMSEASSQWVISEIDTKASFRSIHAVNSKVVWAGGSQGTVLKTTNGGANWIVLKVAGYELLDFRGIYAMSHNVAFIMSAGEAEKAAAVILKTEDGGVTWKEVFRTFEKGVFLDALKFRNAKVGYVLGDPVGNKPYVLKTTDGGKSWARIAPEKFPDMKEGEASFAAGNSCLFVLGDNVWFNTQGRVFVSNDNGGKWEAYQTQFTQGKTSGIFGIYFWSKTDGIAVGGDYVNDKDEYLNNCKTYDGGKTWFKTNNSVSKGLKEAVGQLPENKLIMVGTTGSNISHDLGKTWTQFDNESFHTLSCYKTDCWAVGAKGNLGKWKVLKK